MTDVMSVGYVYFRQNRQGLGGRSIFGITKVGLTQKTRFLRNILHIWEKFRSSRQPSFSCIA
ncbi:hypothetical protein QUB06_30425 [Microcoleus sp. D2_18a_D3]